VPVSDPIGIPSAHRDVRMNELYRALGRFVVRFSLVVSTAGEN
jgi:hypothetical protein